MTQYDAKASNRSSSPRPSRPYSAWNRRIKPRITTSMSDLREVGLNASDPSAHLSTHAAMPSDQSTSPPSIDGKNHDSPVTRNGAQATVRAAPHHYTSLLGI